ncbi:MAG: DNA polymerase III subunit gamma/tau [Bacteroidales bacterium]|nr:DNA polymerase III subunit gamma/tau [Bacteroidales bacterium]
MSGSQFIVSARKYRPATFDTVVGQSTITGTLKNAIRHQHLAQAYLFCGPRGVGKTTCARILAKTLNCLNRTESIEPCDRCESCKAFSESRSYNIFELDAASNNSVEDIRSLIDKVRIPPQLGKYSIYIIDEVHMLSSSAFNAFLKTLEEPPAHAIFILATTEKHKIIPTILSRCQIFDFNRIRTEDIAGYLRQISDKEGVACEADGLHVIAQKAEGGMRDALSIYDQIVSYCGNRITYRSVIENLNVLDYEYYFKLTDAFLAHDIGTALITFNEILDKGFDGHNFITGLGSHFRDLLVCKDPVTLSLLDTGDNIRERYREQAARCGTGFLFDALNHCSTCDVGYKVSKNQRLHVEITLFRLCEIGTGKKKSDAPTVSVTPAKPTATTVPKVPPRNEISSISIKEELSKPPPPRNGIPSISIKEDLSKPPPPQEDTTTLPISEKNEERLAEPVTQEALATAWTSFAEMHKAESQYYSLLTSAIPQLEKDTRVNFTVGNTFQQEAFQKIHSDLLNHLRRQLKNHQMEIFLALLEKPDVPKTARTPEEKFVQMCKKNPLLTVLRQKLMLDFE